MTLTNIEYCEEFGHDYEATFQGGDTYKCSRCGKEIDMTEEEAP